MRGWCKVLPHATGHAPGCVVRRFLRLGYTNTPNTAKTAFWGDCGVYQAIQNMNIDMHLFQDKAKHLAATEKVQLKLCLFQDKAIHLAARVFSSTKNLYTDIYLFQDKAKHLAAEVYNAIKTVDPGQQFQDKAEVYQHIKTSNLSLSFSKTRPSTTSGGSL